MKNRPTPSWQEFIAGLRLKRDDAGELAVHRPLLLLLVLAQARAGGSNQFRFVELVDPLKKALRDFGPDRKTLHPEYPFWHLQDENFWVVEGKEGLPSGSRNASPTQGELRRAGAVGVIPPAQWKALTDNPALIEELTEELLEPYWPDSSEHREIRQHFGL
jgi:putative restriction endonuclease